MGLNIKNENVHRLAREAAERTGRTQTGAIETALERYLAELDQSTGGLSNRDRVTRIVASVDARLTEPARSALLEAGLYDESGLPA